MIFKRELEIHIEGNTNAFCGSKCRYLKNRGFCDILNIQFGVCHLFGQELKFYKNQKLFKRSEKCRKIFKYYKLKK
jgi:hypothetical protein